MAKRRGKGEGSISLRPDGRWMARCDMGRTEDGQRQRKTVYGSTRAAVATKLNEQLGKAAAGELLTSSTPTLKSWLNSWFDTFSGSAPGTIATWSTGTQRVYRCAIDEWLVPPLGATRLEKLTPFKIQKWINGATVKRASEKVVLAHCVLRSALRWAMKQRVLTYNPAALVEVPRPVRKPITPLSAEQSRTLLETAAGHPLGAMIVTSLLTGLRIGEVGGVSWKDLDLDARTLQVCRQVQSVKKGTLTLAPLKTRNSRRALALPMLVVDALKARRVVQLEERMRAGAAWSNPDDLAFTTPLGAPVHPSKVRVILNGLLEAAGLARVKFHTLRHSAATMLLVDGTPLFDVSRVLGHAQVSTTADIYGHLVPEMAAGAAARMDTLLKTGSKA